MLGAAKNKDLRVAAFFFTPRNAAFRSFSDLTGLESEISTPTPACLHQAVEVGMIAVKTP